MMCRRPLATMVALFCFLTALPAVLLAQSEDELFGGDIVRGEDDQDDGDQAGATGNGSSDGSAEGSQDGTGGGGFSGMPPAPGDFLVSDEVRLGGRYSFRFAPTMSWIGFDDLGDIDGNYDTSFGFDLGAQLYLDARPNEDFRVYAETELSYPFRVEGGSEAGSAESSRGFDDILTITELFSDFQLGDALFLRGGKHTVTWGVGYFFSPADIINLERIDPENPDADREGPVSLRTQLPFEANNAYLYLLPPIGSQEFPSIAPKLEVVVDLFEIGLGGYWRYDERPAGMLTIDGSVWDFDVFGEAVVLGETDRVYVDGLTPPAGSPPGTPLQLETSMREDPVFQATAGLGYSYGDVAGNLSLSAFAQYFYNGEGYEDPSVLIDNREAISQALALSEDDPPLTQEDLSRTGMHYSAVSLALRSILGSDVSLSSLWYANLSDASGRISGDVSYRVTDYLSLSGGAAWLYGPTGAEFTPAGDTFELTLGLSFGSGRF